MYLWVCLIFQGTCMQKKWLLYNANSGQQPHRKRVVQWEPSSRAIITINNDKLNIPLPPLYIYKYYIVHIEYLIPAANSKKQKQSWTNPRGGERSLQANNLFRRKSSQSQRRLGSASHHNFIHIIIGDLCGYSSAAGQSIPLLVMTFHVKLHVL